MPRALLRSSAFFALLVLTALAQRGGRFQGGGGRFPERETDDSPMSAQPADFHFVRLEYTDLPQYHRRFGWSSRDGQGSGWWNVDWPAADNHFTQGIQRLTRIDTGDPQHFRLTDDRVFDHPWIYATQTGWWDLSDAETARLREYLLRGGFLVVDDFWGPEQWDVFRSTMERTLPGEPIDTLAPSDSIMHVLYDIQPKDLMFIPGSRHLRRNGDGSATVMQPPGQPSAWLALRDPRQRMVVAVNFNTDVGDAWEFADVPYYPAAMTSLAYRYGINYIVYAMTH
jgi:hypothetical protein